MEELWSHVGITPGGALGVAFAAVVLYLVYSAVLAVWGPRLTSSSSTLALALMTVLGSVFARAMLGDYPTLAGALVACATLLVLEFFLGRLRRATGRFSGRRRAVVVLVDGGFVNREAWRKVITEADLLTRMRTAGVRHVAEVPLVILERRGVITCLRPGETIGADLLAGVDGADLVPARLLRGERSPEQ